MPLFLLAMLVPGLLLQGADDAAAQRLGTVDAITVVGNRAADRELILNSIGIDVGDPLTRSSLTQAIRRLFALGLFDDVDIYGEEVGPERVRLEVRVVEKRRLSKLIFEGVEKIDERDLRERLTITEGQIFDDRSLSEQIRLITEAYKEKGYSQVQVQADVTASEKEGPGRVHVTFTVEEGRKVKIRRVELAGIDPELVDMARDGIKTKKKGWLWGGDFKEEVLREDLGRIAQNLRNHGFKDAVVEDYDLDFHPSKPELAIVIHVEPGPRYVMGEATFQGNEVLDLETLESAVTFLPGDPYSEERIQETLSNIYALYAERGYIYVAVDPRPDQHGDTVDIDFRIGEGEPSHVRQVVIRGNTRTKEKVVRRQLVIRPGQKFSRSALVRSQRDVFQLGFFEDVRVDFERAAASTSDIDVIFDVKEKQTGTLQAGAGFSSDGGLTGFLELGHNNLFGNGQQISIKLENGSRRSVQEISFTEPWFRDTPTSVGFDLFNTIRIRDIYDDRRRGGAIRVGRRLPWPDYTTGFVSYRFERVTIENVDEGIALDTSNFPRNTSSMSFAVSRNSTDNPFYPTSGSRVTWRSEFAGGWLGGTVDFHKHVLDARTYIPTAWRPVLMLRSRTGILDSYGRDSEVPDYETFRLGGTTTNYLRGYPDYEVVPRGNDLFPGGRLMMTLTAELQFLVAEPLHGLLFLDAGDTWNSTDDLRLSDLRKGAGIGMRIEIPLLGVIGFDYAYGFDRAGGGQWEPHFLIGNLF
ncbi:MAG: outer membrane protein assembly factor BamA [Candidatus Eiseniibacteriota bacterium]